MQTHQPISLNQATLAFLLLSIALVGCDVPRCDGKNPNFTYSPFCLPNDYNKDIVPHTDGPLHINVDIWVSQSSITGVARLFLLTGQIQKNEKLRGPHMKKVKLIFKPKKDLFKVFFYKMVSKNSQKLFGGPQFGHVWSITYLQFVPQS